jgi:hypothetical protein
LAAEQHLIELPIALDASEATSFHVTRSLLESELDRNAGRKRGGIDKTE